MARDWLRIRVELIEGSGRTLWPRPGRVFVAPRSTTFAAFAEAINLAFARWDLAHLWAFELADGTRIEPEADEIGIEALNGDKMRISRLAGGERFLYVYDLGDEWLHLCTVDAERVAREDDPELDREAPDGPLVAWGWGDVPDQYGRRFEIDDGEGPLPEDPGKGDLPPFRPWWGAGAHDFER